MKRFLKYFATLALDVENFSESDIDLLKNHKELNSLKQTYFEDGETVEYIVVDMKNSIGFLNFLADSLKNDDYCPYGGIAFVNINNKEIFNTNWELHECWEWYFIINEIKKKKKGIHIFSATGADLEYNEKSNKVFLQHLDHEDPRGMEASRSSLNGAMFEDSNYFVEQVIGILKSLAKIRGQAVTEIQRKAFDYVFDYEMGMDTDKYWEELVVARENKLLSLAVARKYKRL